MARGYNQDCPVARTLDVVGERWTLLLLRDLFVQGPRRFLDFLESSPGLSPSMLSTRLKRLEAEGILASELYSDHPPRLEYSLTAKGRALGPTVRALRDWGRKHA